MMESNNLRTVLNKNFDELFDDVLLFRDSIPAIAKMIGVNNFMEAMKFTKTQYYSRTAKPEKWDLKELMKAAEIFKEYNLGN